MYLYKHKINDTIVISHSSYMCIHIIQMSIRKELSIFRMIINTFGYFGNCMIKQF